MGRGSIFRRRRSSASPTEEKEHHTSTVQANPKSTSVLAVETITAPSGEAVFSGENSSDQLKSQIAVLMRDLGPHVAVVKDEEIYEVHLSRREKVFTIQILLPDTFPIAAPRLFVRKAAHPLLMATGEVTAMTSLTQWNCHTGSNLPSVVQAVVTEFKDLKPIIVSSEQELEMARLQLMELIKMREANRAAENAKRNRDKRMQREGLELRQQEAAENARLRRVRASEERQKDEERQKAALLRRVRSASVQGSSKPLSFPRRVSVVESTPSSIPVIIDGGSPATSPVKLPLALVRRGTLPDSPSRSMSVDGQRTAGMRNAMFGTIQEYGSESQESLSPSKFTPADKQASKGSV